MNEFQRQALDYIRESGPLAEGPNRTSAGNQLGRAIGCHRNAAMRILGELERAGQVGLRRRGRTITRAWIAGSEEPIPVEELHEGDTLLEIDGEPVHDRPRGLYVDGVHPQGVVVNVVCGDGLIACIPAGTTVTRHPVASGPPEAHTAVRNCSEATGRK